MNKFEFVRGGLGGRGHHVGWGGESQVNKFGHVAWTDSMCSVTDQLPHG